MEVKIGVQHVAREITFQSDQTPDEVAQAVAAAAKDGSLLTLRDERGRTVIVPGDRVGYVEIGESAKTRVGFGSL
ncbi:DUF3107 domain-containing protein [Arsenicicoccus sp. oral taxon 190]|uniref:DUF3107 domain-containing protein n=1 Tax=Arsenicicoccus sp. oral taxon 190 TaxID=1658671 RepID=UPI00067A14B7|nr:DUF3107 domain-containing protein [Arsenicicoccus sp. oral taxon 190]AKT51391.1 ATP-binding protein [Arsenicicoccus sp. oral taxon 190]